jgi:hypothetical protein
VDKEEEHRKIKTHEDLIIKEHIKLEERRNGNF